VSPSTLSALIIFSRQYPGIGQEDSKIYSFDPKSIFLHCQPMLSSLAPSLCSWLLGLTFGKDLSAPRREFARACCGLVLIRQSDHPPAKVMLASPHNLWTSWSGGVSVLEEPDFPDQLPVSNDCHFKFTSSSSKVTTTALALAREYKQPLPKPYT
jgi:hypothetical protein